MSSTRRQFSDDSVVHVINRGNDRRLLFAGDADYAAFVGLLSWAASRTNLRVLGYAVMPNHWHLVLWPESASQLSNFLQRVTSAHAAIFRRRSGTTGTGHVYQGRYRARLIGTDLHYFNVLRYVEANPVRAGLVDRAEEWRWSSAWERTTALRLLSDGPLQLPPIDDWLQIVNQPLTPAQADAVRARRPRSGVGTDCAASGAESMTPSK